MYGFTERLKVCFIIPPRSIHCGKWSSVALGRIATVIFTSVIPIMGTRSRHVRKTDGKAGGDYVTKLHYHTHTMTIKLRSSMLNTYREKVYFRPRSVHQTPPRRL